MITLETYDPAPGRLQGAYLAVGNFDGVHRGHARLVERLRTLADRDGVAAVALTFDPHPVALLRPGSAPSPLVWTTRKDALLRRAGATETGVFCTGGWLLGLTAREFFDRVVVGQFAARGMIEGPNFGFGRDRGGDSQLLAGWCRAAGMTFEIAEPTEIDGRFISSSAIRSALDDGRLDDATAMLGRPHRLRGVVVHGEARGAALGFPTANLADHEALVPVDGVYAAHAFLDDAGPPLPAAVHVGANVTFGQTVRTVEAHLIGFSGDLYGRFVELDLLALLRPSRKFEGVDDLLRQIRLDVDAAQVVCDRVRSMTQE